jgi:hypothetical protein
MPEALSPRSALPFREFLAAFFQSLDASGVRYCVLRNYQEFPARNLGNDIDILIEPSALPRAVHALRSISGVRIAGYTERACVANVFLEGIDRETESCALEIDFDLSLTWKGLPYLSVEELLAAAVVHPAGNASFFAPAPVHEAIVSLFASLLIGGWMKEKYFPQVQETFAECRTEAVAALAPRFGPVVAARLVYAVIEGDRSRILDLIGPLRRELLQRTLRRRPLHSVAAILHHYVSEICFRYSPQSRESVSILAMDSGGSEVIAEALLPRLQSMAVKVECMAEPTVALRDLADLFRWIAAEWQRVLRKRKVLTLILGAGSCPFFGLDAALPPAWLVRLIGNLTPSPDLCILLNAGTEEGSPASFNRHEACRSFLKSRKKSVVLDAGEPAEVVIENAYAAILDTLVQRAESRLRQRFGGSH